MSPTTRWFFGVALVALGGAATLNLFFLAGQATLWAAMVHLTIFGWISGMIFGVSYHTMPNFAAREWPHPRLGLVHLGLFTLGVLCATIALWQDEMRPLVGGLLIQAAGAILFVVHTILMMVRGKERATHLSTALGETQRQIDRIGTMATKIAALVLPIVLLLLAATAQGWISGGWWLATEHLAVLGWVMMMVVGVAYHVLPRFSGHPLRGPRWARAQLACHVVAIIVMVPALGFGWGGLFVVGALLMTAAFGLFAFTVQPAVRQLRRPAFNIALDAVRERSP